MQFLIIPIGLMMWYLAYKGKPLNVNYENFIWDEENYNKRIKLQNILKKNI